MDKTFASTDPQRKNVSGIRHTYRELSDGEREGVDAIKSEAQGLWDIIDDLQHVAARPGSARSYALAKTKIEEAVFWAVHGLTNPEPMEGGDAT